MDIAAYNKDAWDKAVAAGNQWTIPVADDCIERARKGDWSIVLTPRKPVPREWFPSLEGARVLGLAAGGGQQGPVLAAAGASVTVLDNSPAQLASDRMMAARHGLDVRTVEGDMRDLSAFAGETFDLIFHPVSNCFVPDVRPVWREAARVLKRGGAILAGFCNPILYLPDPDLEKQGIITLKHTAPHAYLAPEGDDPLDFGHTLEDQIGGQCDAGLLIAGFYEDGYDPAEDALSRHLQVFIATRAVKPSYLLDCR